MGLVSSLGNSVNQVWDALLAGKTGVRAFPEWAEHKGLRCLVAAPAHPYDTSFLLRKARRTMSAMSEMATIATLQAMKHAGFAKQNL
jgi:3-oxoacyl-(acyl-carrier-protein) synthase